MNAHKNKDKHKYIYGCENVRFLMYTCIKTYMHATASMHVLTVVSSHRHPSSFSAFSAYPLPILISTSQCFPPSFLALTITALTPSYSLYGCVIFYVLHSSFITPPFSFIITIHWPSVPVSIPFLFIHLQRGWATQFEVNEHGEHQKFTERSR